MKKILCFIMSMALSINVCNQLTLASSPEAILNDMRRSKSTADCLCEAVCRCDYDLVKYIIDNEKDCDVNQRDYMGELPLYAAVLLSNDENKVEEAKKIVDLLLEHGADPNLTHEKGISVLELFTMADRSCFNEVFAKHGFIVPEYRKH